MALDLVQIRALAKRKEDENWRFRQYLKAGCNLKSDEIDRRVFETTAHVWAGIDCTTCANCCRELKPTFSEEEVDRVALRLGMERQRFIESYLERTEADDEKPWQTRSTPCPFLESNLCSIYEDRPADCSEYPYLYKPGFASRTLGMIERTFTCPIVYEVMEELKKSLGFRRERQKPGAPAAYRTQDSKGTKFR
jgi:Fe-S-cluster containining protein